MIGHSGVMTGRGPASRPVKLVLASNRAPLTAEVGEDGERRLKVGSGGLAPAMWAVVQGTDATYVATTPGAGTKPGSPAQPDVIPTPAGPLNMVHIQPDAMEYELFYNAFSNPFLWFVQHQMYSTDGSAREGTPPPADQIEYAWREGYLPVNEQFAQTIAATIADDAVQPVVMLQDYHLYCVAPGIRAARPDAVITQFVHIPWPAPEIWRQLVPAHILRDLMRGLAANDIVGFQTDRDRENFLDTCVDVLGARRQRDGSGVSVMGRDVRARTYPISIDVAERKGLRHTDEVEAQRQALVGRVPRRQRRLLAVGRLDLSKNMVNTLAAFDRVCAADPERARNMVFQIIANPTRDKIAEYAGYRAEFDRLVAEINERHRDPANPDHRVVEVHWTTEDMALAAAAMERADVIVVTSIADGMNLAAKDAVVLNQRNGTLVLTETCGAFHELGRHAVGVKNPRDVDEIAAALEEALEMPGPDRYVRMRQMKQQVSTHDVQVWKARQMADIEAVLEGRQTAGPALS
jgi:trehalose 6-phosphate synthase